MKILILVGIALVAFGLKALYDVRVLKLSSVKVMAEVLATSGPTQEIRVPRDGRVTLRYTYQGKEFQSSYTAHDDFWKALKPGEQVEIAFNENKPSQVIPSHQLPQAGWMGYALIGMGLVIFCVGFLKR